MTIEEQYDEFFGTGYWEKQYKEQICIFAKQVLEQRLDAGQVETYCYSNSQKKPVNDENYKENVMIGDVVVPLIVSRKERLQINHGAKLCLGYLVRYKKRFGKIDISQVDLADQMGVSRRMVTEYLKQLKMSGFLESHRRGMGKTNTYEIKNVQTV